jgi:hypothetical protein
VLVRGVVVAHHPQLLARVGSGGLRQEAQELAVAVAGIAGVGDRAKDWTNPDQMIYVAGE